MFSRQLPSAKIATVFFLYIFRFSWLYYYSEVNCSFIHVHSCHNVNTIIEHTKNKIYSKRALVSLMHALSKASSSFPSSLFFTESVSMFSKTWWKQKIQYECEV